MTGDTLTIAVGLAGVLASVFCAWFAFRFGVKQAERQTTLLLAGTSRQNAELASATDSRSRQLARSLREDMAHALLTSAGTRGAHGSQSTESIVRSTLARLVDERGEVPVIRLLEALASSKARPPYEATVAVLERLRDAGLVQLTGGSGASTSEFVKVCPPGER